ncbi:MULTISPECIES: FxsA family membrane protein [unclassified Streptomyces]|uniref:FxsA family membrane protein n=1 Tax=unclassified Streptomyces TaxID=2593676 RepID=UPI002DDBF448|nr:FxsA family membrane protein [Streptomyces sp. NBC_01795]WSA96489.1 FxsA family protein [Streptomyces sp. NBC_01795]WSS39584.1 FxsA family protein [Streptomyces sp. NBC_01187]
MTTRAPFPYEPSGQEPGDGTGGPGGPGQGPEGPRRRSKGRTLLPLGVAAWVVLEIWLLTLLADAAGGLIVLIVLVAGFLIGSAVIKRAGRRAWRNLAESVQRAQEQAGGGEPRPEAEGRAGRGSGMAMLGGLLIMIPGLVSDAAGLLCLFPPTAKLLRGSTKRYLERRSDFEPGSLGDAYQQARGAEEQVRMHRPDGKVVQGEVVRDDEQGRD